MDKNGVKQNNKLFGTDGIRSKYGTYPLDDSSIINIGKAIGQTFKGSKILIGRDTRVSGVKLEKLLNIGLLNLVDVYKVGVIPTPTLSFLVSSEDFDYGIMITASHNVYYDNGLKLFKCNGEKISKEDEEKIEKNYFIQDDLKLEDDNCQITNFPLNGQYAEYIYNIVKKYNLTFTNKDGRQLKLVIDCANGAFYKEAKNVLSFLGYKDIVFINDEPNGKNINDNCGALYTDNLIEVVKRENAELGIAFDGDGDRLICVDSKGAILDGDYILLMIARYLNVKKNDKQFVVGTVMSNLGLERALNEENLKFIRADVGDKYVYKDMLKYDAIVGGEQSGHIIIKGFKTGDGLLSALFFISALNYFEIDVNDVSNLIKTYPQILKSYNVKEKVPIEKWDELNYAIEEFKEKNADNSRIVVRYSGTELKLRVMIESDSYDIVNKSIDKFESIIKAKSSWNIRSTKK